jgi:DNA-binding transcriptional regulator YdaS (Cro superfamily)
MKTQNPHAGAEALRLAIKRADGVYHLSAALKVKPQAISNWISRGTPKERCLAIENLTGIRCEELRPDINWSALREVVVTRARRSLDASDDAQPPVGGSSDKLVESRMVA